MMTIDEAITYLKSEMPYHKVGVAMGLENGKIWEAVEVLLVYSKNKMRNDTRRRNQESGRPL